MIIKSDSLILTKDIQKLSFINPKLYMPNKWGWFKKEVVKYNGEYYYMKKVDNKELINEFIGSYLSKKINLDVINYMIAIDDAHNLYVMSKLFYEKDKKYYKPYEFGYTTYHLFDINIDKYNFLNALKELNGDVLNDFLKMVALDIKMLQSDRNATNIMFSKDKEGLYKLMPAYDFGEAYTNNYELYYNPYLVLWMNHKDIKRFINDYEDIKKYIDILKNINVTDIIEEIEYSNGITLSEEELSFYKEKDKEINKFLKKI